MSKFKVGDIFIDLSDDDSWKGMVGIITKEVNGYYYYKVLKKCSIRPVGANGEFYEYEFKDRIKMNGTHKISQFYE